MAFSCDNSILNVRKRDEENREVMVYQTERDVQANETFLIEVKSSSIYLQFHAPRRSCRINIGSEAIASGTPSKVCKVRHICLLPYFNKAASKVIL